jgi:5'-3' exonuclease
MGIPHYFYLLTKTHSNILRFTPPPAKDFYLDFNGAVYNAYYKRLAEGGAPPAEATIYSDTWQYFEGLVAAVGVEDGGVHICMDGVAPKAKMVQQRKRRFMTMAREQLLAAAGAPVDGGAASWDTNAISPGTTFMVGLTSFLTQKCASGRATFSGPDEAGEGEHKIFAALAAAPAAAATVIYGLDADLIMLSLLSNTPGIYLMREQAQAGVRGAAPPDAPFVYLNIDALRVAVLAQLRDKYGWAVSPRSLSSPYDSEGREWIEIYVVLCFFLGNDFLPSLPTLHMKGDGLETLLLAYRHAHAASGAHLVEKGNVSYTFIAALLHVLANDEDGRVRAHTEDYVRRRAHASKPDERVEFYPILPENKDPVAHAILNARDVGWRAEYHGHLFDGVDIPGACMTYLEGVLWTHRYYKRHAKDGHWTYPHGYAPSTKDLAHAAQAHGGALAALGGAWDRLPAAASDAFVSTDVQLLSILPIKSEALLPAHLRPFMRDADLGCAHLYPRTFRLHTYMKTRLWECSPVLPPLDVAWIEECLKINSKK